MSGVTLTRTDTTLDLFKPHRGEKTRFFTIAEVRMSINLAELKAKLRLYYARKLRDRCLCDTLDYGHWLRVFLQSGNKSLYVSLPAPIGQRKLSS